MVITDVTENKGEERGLFLFWEDGRVKRKGKWGAKKSTSIIKGSKYKCLKLSDKVREQCIS